MLTAKQERVIDKYVDDKYYNVEKLKKYLGMHSVVGNEVFGYCDRNAHGKENGEHSRRLDDEHGYMPLDIETFIRRVPFFFYVAPEDATVDNFCTLDFVIPDVDFRHPEEEAIQLERFYKDLEFMYYELKIPLVDIFNYGTRQCGRGRGVFPKWCDYLHLCVEILGWTDYMPDRFITRYNEALESCGREPIIYEVEEILPGECLFRDGRTIEFSGVFPCDNNGDPIMKWIGLSVSHAEAITCSCEKSDSGKLNVIITPRTVIKVLNFYNSRNESGDYWYQVYAGPQHMEFDVSVLKSHRQRLKMTQQEVADAVGAAVRTYQKWENGTTTPDGYYLLKLMNWLDIPSAQDLIRYVDE